MAKQHTPKNGNEGTLDPDIEAAAKQLQRFTGDANRASQ